MIRINPNTKRSISAPPLVPKNEKEIKKYSNQIISILKKKFDFEKGRHRVVFFDRKNNEVIKIPISDSGIAANFQELDYQDDNLAITNLDEKLSIKYHIPIIRMEYVKPISMEDLEEKEGKIPGWVYSIDSAQVGYTKDGRLVAYDWDTY